MVLKIGGFMLALALGGVSMNSAVAEEFSKAQFYTVDKMVVSEISEDPLGNDLVRLLSEKVMYIPGLPNERGMVDPTEKVGKVITIARNLVALGEDIYRLVIKGKPSNSTSYAPISVVPVVNGQITDILDTENWLPPVQKTYEVAFKNGYGINVVVFRYSVLYSYGGSFQGKGAYLTAVQIVPESVRTLFGFDFTATMKLGGIINEGTVNDPVAGATLLMEYTVSSVIVAQNKVDKYFVNGRGEFKEY
jgi:hypothetical protein